MKLSEFQQVLTRVQQLAGDVEVVLRHAEEEAETVITDLGIHLDPTTGTPTGSLVVTHGAAPAAAPAEATQADQGGATSADTGGEPSA